jgi:16S rRNA (adenine1518-N6/adenine1519-N6)-dimethyltransferase
VEADLLELPTLPVPTPARVAGNLPYNVASPILIRLVDFFQSGAPIIDATVMLQREVADRLLAPPGSRDYGTLTVIVTHAADACRLFNLPPGAFRPAPRVESTLVRLRFRPPAVPVPDRERFRWLVQSVFMHRRKTLANALKSVAPSASELLLRRAGIDGTRRPETLSVDEFARLAGNL